jgi:hypothetical protein
VARTAAPKAAKTNKFKKFLNKRTFICAGLAVVVAVGGVFLYKGVSKNNVRDLAARNIAEAQYFMQFAEAPTFNVQFYTGIREENFVQDGIATKTVPFAIVTVSGNATFKPYPELRVQIRIANEQYDDVILKKSPYNALSFSADIAAILRGAVTSADEIEVTLCDISTANPPSVRLAASMDDVAITWDEAVDIATKNCASNLKGKKFETTVTIINNVGKDSGAFWYVQFFTNRGETYYCVIATDGTAICNQTGRLR